MSTELPWTHFQELTRVDRKAVLSAKNSISDKENWGVKVNKLIKTGKGKEEIIKDYKLLKDNVKSEKEAKDVH